MDHLDKRAEGLPQDSIPQTVTESHKITPLGKTKSGGAAKIDAAVRGRFNSLAGEATPTLTNRDISHTDEILTGSKEMSDLEFISSLEGKLSLTDAEVFRLEKLQGKVSSYEEEELTPETREINDKIGALMENSSFAEMIDQSFQRLDLIKALSQIQKDREFIQNLKNDAYIGISDIVKLLDIYRNRSQVGLLEDETSQLLDQELSELMNSAFFQSSLRTAFNKNSNTLSNLTLLERLKEYPFDESFSDELEFDRIEFSYSLCTRSGPLEDGEVILEENNHYLMQAESDGTLLVEYEVIALNDSLNNRFSTLLSLLEVGKDYAVQVGDQTFRCKKEADGSIIIKDPTESFKRDFINSEFAAAFLSINKNSGSELIHNQIVWCKLPEFTKIQFDQDLSFIKSLDFSVYTFAQFELLGEFVDRIYENNGYYLQQKEQLINMFKSKIQKFSKQGFFGLVKSQNPQRVIRLLQQLQRLPVNDQFTRQLKAFFYDTEIKMTANLFVEIKKAADGVNQENFESEEHDIQRGEANFCCGSMTVAALVERKRKTGKTLNQILEDGVIRHLKLGPEQMDRLSHLAEILTKNEEVVAREELIMESFNSKGKVAFDRYELILNRIEKGCDGVMLADAAFFMCAVNEDESVEIFDSHGSSIPLITGAQNPAYRAFFKDRKSAAAYLSVHRRIDNPRSSLVFFPLEVKPN